MIVHAFVVTCVLLVGFSDSCLDSGLVTYLWLSFLPWGFLHLLFSYLLRLDISINFHHLSLCSCSAFLYPAQTSNASLNRVAYGYTCIVCSALRNDVWLISILNCSLPSLWRGIRRKKSLLHLQNILKKDILIRTSSVICGWIKTRELIPELLWIIIYQVACKFYSLAHEHLWNVACGTLAFSVCIAYYILDKTMTTMKAENLRPRQPQAWNDVKASPCLIGHGKCYCVLVYPVKGSVLTSLLGFNSYGLYRLLLGIYKLLRELKRQVRWALICIALLIIFLLNFCNTFETSSGSIPPAVTLQTEQLPAHMRLPKSLKVDTISIGIPPPSSLFHALLSSISICR